MSITEKFNSIIEYLIGCRSNRPAWGLDVTARFHPYQKSTEAAVQNISISFLVLLAGRKHPLYDEAMEYLESTGDELFLPMTDFIRDSVSMVSREIEMMYDEDSSFQQAFDELSGAVSAGSPEPGSNDSLRLVMNLFFPEGQVAGDSREEAVTALRDKRKVTITSQGNPINEPGSEVLFTANALLTVPPDSKNPDDLAIDSDIKDDLAGMTEEKQLYWYDHPIQIGTSPESNEVIYGLQNLAGAFRFEMDRGNMEKGSAADCVMSVSVTHKGLHKISRKYLESELKRAGVLDEINVFVFTENDTDKIIDALLKPAAQKYLNEADMQILTDIFGVDGRYGRHYSFLKAIAPFWRIFISDKIRATFKIDLDQVFPQETLVEETGMSAFEHLKSPLWGASGLDSRGRKVHLGMLAGALVNEKDIGTSLFTPDVKFPGKKPFADEYIFRSALPQALSTEAEMMTRYSDSGEIDGKETCIQRIHVTGGTNGILVDSLMKYRPFAPSFVGRAEDQSYILSVLFDDPGDGFLRYVHRDGLIMRHDKEAFAGEAIKSAKVGKMIGDYIRILLFSAYSEALPWPRDEVKDAVDPFTGCFISRIPLTVVMLRFVLRTIVFFHDGDAKNGVQFFTTGVARLQEMINWLNDKKNPVRDRYKREREGWGLYYRILETIEEKISAGDPFALELRDKARKLVDDCRLVI